MKKLILFAGMLCAFLSNIDAQTKGIQGKVIDKLTGEPVSGASIKIKDLNIVKTDRSGNFKIEVGNADTLFISCSGFKTCCYVPASGPGRSRWNRTYRL